MKKFVNLVMGIVLLVMCVMNCVLVKDLEDKTTQLIECYDIEPEIIFIDSLVYDSIYLTKTEVVRLPIVDTLVLTDTIIHQDSVYVEIPISTYHYDTTFAETHISLMCEGFDVRLNSLLIENLKMPTIEQKVPKKWYENIHLGTGLSVTYIDKFRVVPSIGIYYKLF